MSEQSWVQSLAPLVTRPAAELSMADLLKWAKERQTTVPNLALVRNPEVTLSGWPKTSRKASALPMRRILSLSGDGTARHHRLRHTVSALRGRADAPRPFNLMLKTHTGPIESDENLAYLRPRRRKRSSSSSRTCSIRHV